MEEKLKVFISYSHKDRVWLDRLRVHLEPLVRDYNLEVWDDTEIDAGKEWSFEIENALKTSQVSVLLISADFLASDFINETYANRHACKDKHATKILFMKPQ